MREVARAAYDGVKMTWADCGRSDTEERSSLGDVVDQAEKHWATLAQQVHADFGPPGAT